MKAKGCKVDLSNNEGFTLPSNIGELGDDITELDLSKWSLQGSCRTSSTQKEAKRGTYLTYSLGAQARSHLSLGS